MAEQASYRRRLVNMYQACSQHLSNGLDWAQPKREMATQESEARRIVQKYMWWAMGAGLIPVPMVDLAAVTSTQLLMLRALSQHYGVPFSKHRGAAIVGALVGTLVPHALARGVVGSALKAVPVVGSLAGAVAMPTFAGAATYALGNVYLMHCEAGGTLLNFDPATMRAHFYREFEAGQEVAAAMHEETESSSQNGTHEPHEPSRAAPAVDDV